MLLIDRRRAGREAPSQRFRFTCERRPGTLFCMNRKSDRISASVAELRGYELDPRYLGYFEYFNRQRYFEAHEVLEALWLADRTGRNGLFYKGLIQLAGAFVHLQKNRLRPAAALLKLAEANLERYPQIHERLNMEEVLKQIRTWLHRVRSHEDAKSFFGRGQPPELRLDVRAEG